MIWKQKVYQLPDIFEKEKKLEIWTLRIQSRLMNIVTYTYAILISEVTIMRVVENIHNRNTAWQSFEIWRTTNAFSSFIF